MVLKTRSVSREFLHAVQICLSSTCTRVFFFCILFWQCFVFSKFTRPRGALCAAQSLSPEHFTLAERTQMAAASPAETRQVLCSLLFSSLLVTLLLSPCSLSFQISPRGWTKSITSLFRVNVHRPHTNSACQTMVTGVVLCTHTRATVASRYAIIHSGFLYKPHTGPFKNRSTQHPPLHDMMSQPGVLLCLPTVIASACFSPFLFFSQWISLVHFSRPRFTSDHLLPSKCPLTQILNWSGQTARMSPHVFGFFFLLLGSLTGSCDLISETWVKSNSARTHCGFHYDLDNVSVDSSSVLCHVDFYTRYF